MLLSFGFSENFTVTSAVAACLGGSLLGAAVVYKTLLTGVTLGVSGTTRDLIASPLSSDRASFVLGLVLSGPIMLAAYGAFEPMPPASKPQLLWLRLLSGGLLVGLGSAFGGGCTSGHGLTGLARLTRRAWVAVPTFMASAVAMGTLGQTADLLPPDAGTERDLPDIWVGVVFTTAGVAVLLASGAVAWLFGGKFQAWKVIAFVEFVSGLVFGCGLVVSGMTRPSKVAAFLDLLSGAWDPSLAFVMSSALLVTFPFFQTLACRRPAAPVLREAYKLPPASQPLDLALAWGAMLFGIGWGLCGSCPGPIWVLLIPRMSIEIVVLVFGMLAGLGIWVAWQHYREREANRVTHLDSTPASVVPRPVGCG